MKKSVIVGTILLICALGQLSHAAGKLFYMNASRHELPADQAIIGAFKGEEIYKCQQQEGKISKNGTSIGVKNVKRSKTSESDTTPN